MVHCHQRLCFMLCFRRCGCGLRSVPVYAYLVILTRYLSLAVTSMLFTSSRPLPLTVTRSPACGHHPQHIHHTSNHITSHSNWGPSQARLPPNLLTLLLPLLALGPVTPL